MRSTIDIGLVLVDTISERSKINARFNNGLGDQSRCFLSHKEKGTS